LCSKSQQTSFLDWGLSGALLIMVKF
jgi:hypothetical protein